MLKTLWLVYAYIILGLMTIPTASYGQAANVTKPFMDLSLPVTTSNSNTDGSFSFSYSFQLPAARGLFQPSVSLNYNSSDTKQRGYGVGWNLSLSYVEVVQPNSLMSASGAVQEMYRIVMPGHSGILIEVAPQSDEYRMGIDQEYFQIQRAGDGWGWKAIDSTGNVFHFNDGRTQTGNECTLSCARWYLTTVEDVNQNIARFEYASTGNSAERLLQKVLYNTYPVNPNNTGSIGESGRWGIAIRFIYGDLSTRDGAPHVEAVAGSLFKHTKILTEVKIVNQVESTSITEFVTIGYRLVYAYSPETGRRLLEKIEMYGNDEVSRPHPVTFKYSSRIDGGLSSYQGLKDGVPVQFQSLPTPTGLECLKKVGFENCIVPQLGAWMDLDGDRRPDLVWDNLYWARNVTPSGSEQLAFESPQRLNTDSFPGTVWYFSPSGEQTADVPQRTLVLSRIQDFNGDHLPDLIYIVPPNNTLMIALGRMTGRFRFDRPVVMSAVGPRTEWAHLYPGIGFGLSIRQSSDILDITGDGIGDFVFLAERELHVYQGYQNSDGQLDFSTQRQVFSLPEAESSLTSFSAGLVDMNGDGLPDRVLSSPDNGWKVLFNTGSSFEPQYTKWGDPDEFLGHLDLQEERLPNNLHHGSRGMLVDLNLDGLPDYLYRPLPEQCPSPCPLVGTLNTGGGFTSIQKLRIQMPSLPSSIDRADIYPYMAPNYVFGHVVRGHRGLLLDFNGDGTPDYVLVNHNGQTVFFKGEAYRGSDPSTGSKYNRSDLLIQITQPGGAVKTLTYETASPQSTGGAIYPLLKEITVYGPGLSPSKERFLYFGGYRTTDWSKTALLRFIGFREIANEKGDTDAQGSIVKPSKVTHTVYHGDFPFTGFPLLVRHGDSSRNRDDGWPEYNDILNEVTTWTARRNRDGACLAWDRQLPPSSYPLLLVRERSETTLSVRNPHTGTDSSFSSERVMPCANIDEFGNAAVVIVDPDTVLKDNEYEIHYSFDSSPENRCKRCVTSESTHGYKKYPTKLGDQLRRINYRYDAPVHEFDPPLPHGKVRFGRLSYVEHWLKDKDGSERLIINKKFRYFGNGLIAGILHVETDSSDSDGQPQESFKYDRYQLRNTLHMLGDSSTQLVTTNEYDPVSGKLIAVDAPSLKDGPVMSRRIFKYDALGRLLSVAQAPQTRDEQTVMLEQYVYNDAEFPLSVASYKSISNVVAEDADLTSSDVREATSYYDGLGRLIQIRERLAGTTPASEGAHVVKELPGYLVSHAVGYDSEGRRWIEVDPYYSSSVQYEDLFEAGRNSGHARLTQYWSTIGLAPRCISYAKVAAAPTRPSSCSVDSTTLEATSFSYMAQILNGRPFLVLDSLADHFSQRTTQLVDASGKPYYLRDAHGNRTNIQYDALGQVRMVTRRVTFGGKTYKAETKIERDTLGRIVRQHDSHLGTKQFAYSPSNKMVSELNFKDASSSIPLVGMEFHYGSLGRLTKETEFIMKQNRSGSPTRTETVTNYLYDRPMTNDDRYSFTPGRLSQIVAPGRETLAFGYTEQGNVAFIDQSINANDQTYKFSTAISHTLDGRIKTTRMSQMDNTGSDSQAYDTYYDSYGRLADVKNFEGKRYYQVVFDSPLTEPTGYDPRGRVQMAKIDDGHVLFSQAFGTNPKYPERYKVLLTSSSEALIDLNTISVTAGRITSLTDQATRTKSVYEYDCDGRLIDAKTQPMASEPPGSSPNYHERYSYMLSNKVQKCARWEEPSLWNLNSVQMEPPPSSDLYSYDPARPDAVIKITKKRGNNIQDQAISYDDRGLMKNDGNHTFEYDAKGRVVKIRNGNTVLEELQYGPTGLIGRTLYQRGSKRKILYAGPFMSKDVEDQSNLRNPTHFNVLANGQRIASVVSTNTVFYHRDRINSVIATTANGKKTGVYRFRPYGTEDVIYSNPEVVENELGYGGGLKLTGGLLYFINRTYHPGIRRFMQPDTIDLHRYTYAGGDPINHIDPDGRMWKEVGENVWQNTETGELLAIGEEQVINTGSAYSIAAPSAGPSTFSSSMAGAGAQGSTTIRTGIKSGGKRRASELERINEHIEMPEREVTVFMPKFSLNRLIYQSTTGAVLGGLVALALAPVTAGGSLAVGGWLMAGGVLTGGGSYLLGLDTRQYDWQVQKTIEMKNAGED